MKISYDHNETLLSLNMEEAMLLQGLLAVVGYSDEMLKSATYEELSVAAKLDKELQPVIEKINKMANESYIEEVGYLHDVYNK